MLKLVISFILLVAAQMASADPQGPAPPIRRATWGDSVESIQAQVRGPVRFLVRRFSNSKAGADAHQRVEAAFSDLAQSKGLTVATADAPADITVEFDSTFYVYTNRFNAQWVRLPEYTEAQLAGTVDAKVAEVKAQPVDVLRIAAGALGIVQGWISPAFGSTMIYGGAAPALFGSGAAPRRLFVQDRERYDRGEQEVNTRVRLLRNGRMVAHFSVRCWTLGDEPPFLIDTLVAESWTGVLDSLQGIPVQTDAAVK